MLRGAIALSAAALLAVSCTPISIEIEDDRAGQPLELREDEALAVVASSTSVSEELVACVEGAFRERDPDLAIVASRQFRDSLFPWFEPSTTPRSDDDLVALMDRPAVRRPIDDLGLRYVVSLTGGSEILGREDGWTGCGLGSTGYICLGSAVGRKIDLTAAVYDLAARQFVGEVTVTSLDHYPAGLTHLPPDLLVSTTEAGACRALAQRVGARGAGTSSNSVESVGN